MKRNNPRGSSDDDKKAPVKKPKKETGSKKRNAEPEKDESIGGCEKSVMCSDIDETEEPAAEMNVEGKHASGSQTGNEDGKISDMRKTGESDQDDKDKINDKESRNTSSEENSENSGNETRDLGHEENGNSSGNGPIDKVRPEEEMIKYDNTIINLSANKLRTLQTDSNDYNSDIEESRNYDNVANCKTLGKEEKSNTENERNYDEYSEMESEGRDKSDSSRNIETDNCGEVYYYFIGDSESNTGGICEEQSVEDDIDKDEKSDEDGNEEDNNAIASDKSDKKINKETKNGVFKEETDSHSSDEIIKKSVTGSQDHEESGSSSDDEIDEVRLAEEMVKHYDTTVKLFVDKLSTFLSDGDDYDADEKESCNYDNVANSKNLEKEEKNSENARNYEECTQMENKVSHAKSNTTRYIETDNCGEECEYKSGDSESNTFRICEEQSAEDDVDKDEGNNSNKEKASNDIESEENSYKINEDTKNDNVLKEETDSHSSVKNKRKKSENVTTYLDHKEIGNSSDGLIDEVRLEEEMVKYFDTDIKLFANKLNSLLSDNDYNADEKVSCNYNMTNSKSLEKEGKNNTENARKYEECTEMESKYNDEKSDTGRNTEKDNCDEEYHNKSGDKSNMVRICKEQSVEDDIDKDERSNNSSNEENSNGVASEKSDKEVNDETKNESMLKEQTDSHGDEKNTRMRSQNETRDLDPGESGSSSDDRPIEVRLREAMGKYSNTIFGHLVNELLSTFLSEINISDENYSIGNAIFTNNSSNENENKRNVGKGNESNKNERKNNHTAGEGGSFSNQEGDNSSNNYISTVNSDKYSNIKDNNSTSEEDGNYEDSDSDECEAKSDSSSYDNIRYGWERESDNSSYHGDNDSYAGKEGSDCGSKENISDGSEERNDRIETDRAFAEWSYCSSCDESFSTYESEEDRDSRNFMGKVIDEKTICISSEEETNDKNCGEKSNNFMAVHEKTICISSEEETNDNNYGDKSNNFLAVHEKTICISSEEETNDASRGRRSSVAVQKRFVAGRAKKSSSDAESTGLGEEANGKSIYVENGALLDEGMTDNRTRGKERSNCVEKSNSNTHEINMSTSDKVTSDIELGVKESRTVDNKKINRKGRTSEESKKNSNYEDIDSSTREENSDSTSYLGDINSYSWEKSDSSSYYDYNNSYAVEEESGSDSGGNISYSNDGEEESDSGSNGNTSNSSDGEEESDSGSNGNTSNSSNGEEESDSGSNVNIGNSEGEEDSGSNGNIGNRSEDEEDSGSYGNIGSSEDEWSSDNSSNEIDNDKMHVTESNNCSCEEDSSSAESEEDSDSNNSIGKGIDDKTTCTSSEEDKDDESWGEKSIILQEQSSYVAGESKNRDRNVLSKDSLGEEANDKIKYVRNGVWFEEKTGVRSVQKTNFSRGKERINSNNEEKSSTHGINIGNNDTATINKKLGVKHSKSVCNKKTSEDYFDEDSYTNADDENTNARVSGEKNFKTKFEYNDRELMERKNRRNMRKKYESWMEKKSIRNNNKKTDEKCDQDEKYSKILQKDESGRVSEGIGDEDCTMVLYDDFRTTPDGSWESFSDESDEKRSHEKSRFLPNKQISLIKNNGDDEKGGNSHGERMDSKRYCFVKRCAIYKKDGSDSDSSNDERTHDPDSSEEKGKNSSDERKYDDDESSSEESSSEESDDSDATGDCAVGYDESDVGVFSSLSLLSIGRLASIVYRSHYSIPVHNMKSRWRSRNDFQELIAAQTKFGAGTRSRKTETTRTNKSRTEEKAASRDRSASNKAEIGAKNKFYEWNNGNSKKRPDRKNGELNNHKNTSKGKRKVHNKKGGGEDDEDESDEDNTDEERGEVEDDSEESVNEGFESLKEEDTEEDSDDSEEDDSEDDSDFNGDSDSEEDSDGSEKNVNEEDSEEDENNEEIDNEEDDVESEESISKEKSDKESEEGDDEDYNKNSKGKVKKSGRDLHRKNFDIVDSDEEDTNSGSEESGGSNNEEESNNEESDEEED